MDITDGMKWFLLICCMVDVGILTIVLFIWAVTLAFGHVYADILEVKKLRNELKHLKEDKDNER